MRTTGRGKLQQMLVAMRIPSVEAGAEERHGKEDVSKINVYTVGGYLQGIHRYVGVLCGR